MNRKVQQPPTLPERFKSSRRAFLQNSALSALGLFGTGLPGISLAMRGDELHIRNYVDVVSLDPASSVSGAEGTLFGAIYQKLLRFIPGDHWDTQLDAAEYFKLTDATHYDFRLKPGQMFNNGYGEMTAEDVKFSFERMIDPAMNAPSAPDMGPLSHVEVKDRYSGTLVLHSPYAAFVTIAVAGPSGAILSRKAVTEAGGRFSTLPPCGSGPYAFKSWQAQRKTVLERNPAWPGQSAGFSELHIYAMSDEKAGEMAFEAGQLDSAWVSVESVEAFERNMPPRSTLQLLPSGRSYWLGMNQANPALADIRIRQAIQYGVNVQAVVEAAWFGLAEVSTGAVPAGMIGHRPSALIPPQGDLDKARALLAEANVQLPLRLRLTVSSKAQILTAAQVIQWSLKKVGIEVEIRSYDQSTFITLGREDLGTQWRDLQLFLQDFIGMADPYYSMTWFITAQRGLWNWERLSNAEFDRLNDQALASTDEAERDQLYQRMQDLMEKSGCYRFITNGIMPQIYRQSIKPAFRPDGFPLLRDFKPASGVS